MQLLRFLVFIASCAGFGAHAADIAATQAWARATVPGQKAGVVYLRLESKGKGDRLIAARADVSEAVELHSMTMEGDVMRMREVAGVELPAGGSVELKPGGLHLMLLGLKAPLKVGSRFALTLKFERSGELKVDVPVRSGAAATHELPR